MLQKHQSSKTPRDSQLGLTTMKALCMFMRGVDQIKDSHYLVREQTPKYFWPCQLY